ncbi:MAG: tetratricopeptide repeat protein [Oscillospiraceae bacterium]|nr:tetratricopeptide repeat protein [Oscillospiraceae bacterium]
MKTHMVKGRIHRIRSAEARRSKLRLLRRVVCAPKPSVLRVKPVIATGCGILPQQKNKVESEVRATENRSQLNHLINQKASLLSELSHCTENLADLYEGWGFSKQQLQEMEELCVICELRFGVAHSRTLDMLQNTAKLYAEHGKYPEAETLLARLFPLRLKVNGRTAEKTLECYALRAVVYEELGDHNAALRALTAFRAFGSDTMPDLFRLTTEECKSIYSKKQAAEKKKS